MGLLFKALAALGEQAGREGTSVNLAHTAEQGAAVAGPCWSEACSSDKRLLFTMTWASPEINLGGTQR